MAYLLFFFLLCVSAFFSGSETALFSLGRVVRLRLEASEETIERMIARLVRHPRDLLITVLFGNELTNIALSIVSAMIISDLLPGFKISQQALISAVVVVPLLLIVGEITPKTIAAMRAEPFSRVVAPPLATFSAVLSPVRWLLRALTGAVVRSLGGHTEASGALRESEFRTMLDAGAREGVVEDQERRMIHNVLDFGDMTVEDVMQPFNEVFTLPEDMSTEEAIAEVAKHNHSRIPIWHNEPNAVVGVIYAKDLLAIRWGVRPPAPIASLMRRPVFTVPDKSATILLDEFRRLHTHMAIVTDTFGRAIGLCTMEDLLEEVFGEITDNDPTKRRRGRRGIIRG